MLFQETKAKVLVASIAKLIQSSEKKFGSAWSLNPSFYSSRESVLLNRYLGSLRELESTPHHVTDNFNIPNISHV